MPCSASNARLSSRARHPTSSLERSPLRPSRLGPSRQGRSHPGLSQPKQSRPKWSRPGSSLRGWSPSERQHRRPRPCHDRLGRLCLLRPRHHRGLRLRHVQWRRVCHHPMDRFRRWQLQPPHGPLLLLVALLLPLLEKPRPLRLQAPPRHRELPPAPGPPIHSCLKILRSRRADWPVR